jgi:hypothetical protein
MKLVRASRAKGPANRAEAWACLSANLALPGAGSLAAGKPIGYYQLALAAGAFLITMGTGIHSIYWMLENWTRIHDPAADPMAILTESWQAIRWPIFGMLMFAASMIWAFFTSWQILAAHPKNPVPPRIA